MGRIPDQQVKRVPIMILSSLLARLFWASLILGCASINLPPVVENLSTKPDHTLWDKVVQDHVDPDGNVNYKALKAQPGALLGYLDHLSDYPPAPDWTRADSLAYYINLYNAATVKLILEHYPVSSIQDIPNPWTSKVIRIGQDYISLGNVEHQILRKMDEPRIHFAINCASVSCPKLWNKAFTAEDMESQLEQLTTDFINDQALNELGESNWELSQIFNWYKSDFKSEGGVGNYVARYAKIPAPEDLKISYKKYDWSLNDARE